MKETITIAIPIIEKYVVFFSLVFGRVSAFSDLSSFTYLAVTSPPATGSFV